METELFNAFQSVPIWGGQSTKKCLGKQERAHLGGCLLSKYLFRWLESAEIMIPVGKAAEMYSAEDSFIL